jgi:opacity protein-like surface antigen
MRKKLTTLLLLLAAAHSAAAQDWSIGVHTGPFVFGDFVKRTMRLGNEEGSERSTDILSAATRAGAAFDIEHSFSERWAVRLETTGTRSPMSVKGTTGDDGFEIDAGDVDVGTLMLPLVFRINRGGALRFHLMGGPAYAAYRIRTGTPSFAGFDGTRTQWGVAVGGGVAWRWSERVAVEGNLADIVTSSPFRESDFPTRQGLDIPKTHNVHTTIGLRVSF